MLYLLLIVGGDILDVKHNVSGMGKKNESQEINIHLEGKFIQ